MVGGQERGDYRSLSTGLKCCLSTMEYEDGEAGPNDLNQVLALSSVP